jgi:RNA polymerase sigma factor (sigma-70 family)
LAGFQVIIIGRFWVRTEAEQRRFHAWVSRQLRSGQVNYAIQPYWSKWEKVQLQEHYLLGYAKERFVELDTQFLIWGIKVHTSFEALCRRYQSIDFDLQTFALDVLQRMKPVLREFHLRHVTAKLETKRVFGAPYENELAALTAWAINHLNLNVNRRAEKALRRDGKTTLEGLLDQVPGNILIALNEKEPTECYLPGDRKTSILSRVARLLEQELPSEARSAEAPAEEFARQEEARIDLNRFINKAHLSPRESKVFELLRKGCTEKEIATTIGVKLGTASALKATAMKKLRKAAGQ